MQIENLKVGMTIKNYKELCKLLDVDVKAGKSKQLQLTDFQRYFDYLKEGNKFIIKEIYNVPKVKVDNRINNKGGNNMKYCDDIETLILYILKESKDNEINLSTNQLLYTLNMINKNYQIGRSRIPRLSELIEVPEDIIYDFYDYTSVELKKKLEQNLNRLKRQCLIFWQKSIKVQVTNIHIEYNIMGQPILDEKGYVIQHKKAEHREATKEEIEILLHIEREILKELGYKDKQQLFLYGNFNTFKSRIKQRIKDYKLNIDYYYHSYKIIYNRDHVIEELEDREKASNNLNNNIVECFKKAYKNKFNKASEKIEVYNLGFTVGIKNEYDLKNSKKIINNEKYIEQNNILIDTLIDCRSIDHTLTLLSEVVKINQTEEDFINEDFSLKFKTNEDNPDIPF